MTRRQITDDLDALLSVLPKDTPPRVCRLLELCLRKDPKQRLRDIGDVRIRLDEPEAQPWGQGRERADHRRDRGRPADRGVRGPD